LNELLGATLAEPKRDIPSDTVDDETEWDACDECYEIEWRTLIYWLLRSANTVERHGGLQ